MRVVETDADDVVACDARAGEGVVVVVEGKEEVVDGEDDVTG